MDIGGPYSMLDCEYGSISMTQNLVGEVVPLFLD